MELSCVIEWWLCLFVLGILVLPATMSLFGRLADRGYAFAKICGLGMVSLVSFITATLHVLPLDAWALRVIVGAIVVAQIVWLIFRARPRTRIYWTLRELSLWRHLIFEEAVFLAAFVFWCWVRSHSPDLSTLEKPMDHGFLKAVLESAYLPAQDMWHSGSSINYYYFGQFVASVLCRLTGIGSGIGYNLMVATTFAATVSCASALVYDLIRWRGLSGTVPAVIGGAIGAGVVALGGNGHALIYRAGAPLLKALGVIPESKVFWFADSTRFINCFDGSTDSTIHEFPFYSFVVGDLHAHMIDIMFVLVFLAFAFMFVLRERERRGEPMVVLSVQDIPVQFVCMGVMLGIMAMTNYWDFAIYFVVSLFLVIYTVLIRKDLGFWRGLLCVIRDMVVLFVVAGLTKLAFQSNFDMISSSVALVQQHSPIWQWLVLWYPGLILFMLFVIVVFIADVPFRSGYIEDRGVCGWVRRIDVVDFFVFIMLLCAVGLIVMPEIIYVEDIYGTAPRANTMFKFTYQAFILFGLSLGYACVRVMRPILPWRRMQAVICGIVVAFLVVVPFVYTSAGMEYALHDDENTLDGLAYLDEKDPDDAATIRWIDENVPGDAVVLEASGKSYTESCRISSATGRATVLGWYVHEWLWRGAPAEEDERVADISVIYSSSDVGLTREKLKKYDVSYVVVGERERSAYPNVDTDKLASLSSDEVTFGGTTVYVIDKDATGS